MKNGRMQNCQGIRWRRTLGDKRSTLNVQRSTFTVQRSRGHEVTGSRVQENIRLAISGDMFET